ncbi:erythromycin esterase family protein [Saccharomonospora xinjiangensis]|uniref:erythromycin esterase family protein n=1 Tax=Saccharomonospora xinjiangensis TaxID=75294 RepID=UPI00351032AC
MTQDIRDLLPASTGLLALGEPTHWEPAFGWVRNDVFARLIDHGFRSIALETDRVGALVVNDFVHDGLGSLDEAMSAFSHDFGNLAPNRQLVAWMRDYNAKRPREQRLTFHGFDAALETFSAPSPRPYLEHARDYLGLDLDIASLTGEDERWSRAEAVLDAAASPGASADADRLRAIADDLFTSLHTRAPELIAATSHARWVRARTHLTAGIGLLRYHAQSARPGDQSARISRLAATRDALMAHNLLDIRGLEARRGATLVYAHNQHLQKAGSVITTPELNLTWFGAGSIVNSLVPESYTFVAGSLGRSETLGIADPEPGTHEGLFHERIGTWGFVPNQADAHARVRTGITPQQGYVPLDAATLDGADAVLHIHDSTAVRAPRAV